MHQVVRQVLCCVLLAAAASAQSPDEDEARFDTQVDQFGDTMCALRVVSLLPLVTVQTSVLALDKITLRQGSRMQFYLVKVPLKKPDGHLTAVSWETRSLSDAETFVRLLQHGKLAGVKVEPRLASFRGRELPESQRDACRGITRQSEDLPKLADRLEECTTCRIKELLLSKQKLKE